jgi:hypothetical protein
MIMRVAVARIRSLACVPSRTGFDSRRIGLVKFADRIGIAEYAGNIDFTKQKGLRESSTQADRCAEKGKMAMVGGRRRKVNQMKKVGNYTDPLILNEKPPSKNGGREDKILVA